MESPATKDYEQIAAIVSERFSVDLDALHSRHKSRRVAFARRIICICLRKMDYSYPEIGAAMGGRNHTTILRACNGQRDARSHDSNDAESLGRAHAEAQRIMDLGPWERNPHRGGFSHEIDYRAEYDKAVYAYWHSFEHEREDLWRRLMAPLFPSTAGTPPREQANAA